MVAFRMRYRGNSKNISPGDECSRPTFTKYRRRLRQSLRFQRIQVLLDRFCRILEAQPVILCRTSHNAWREIQQMQNEFVGMSAPRLLVSLHAAAKAGLPTRSTPVTVQSIATTNTICRSCNESCGAICDDQDCAAVTLSHLGSQECYSLCLRFP
jgi:hypothetical protein